MIKKSIDSTFEYDGGGRIILKAMNSEFVTDAYLRWFEKLNVTEYLDAKRISRNDAVSYIENGYQTKDYFMLAIIHKEHGEHIGNVKIGPIQWNHGVSDLVTVIGNDAYWGAGYATEAIKMGGQVAFDNLGIRKLSGGIAEGNIGSVKAYTKAGWEVEGTLEGHHLINGEPRDRIVVSCFNPHYFGER